MSNMEKEFQKTVVSLRWVTAVSKGGKRQRICAFVVVGDSAGSIGYSTGKAKEVSTAVKKAIAKASCNMCKFNIKDSRTVHHDMTAEYCASRIVIRKAPLGFGICASGSVRSALVALGIKDINVKTYGSRNPYNTVKVLFKSLFMIKSARSISSQRNITRKEVTGTLEKGEGNV